MLPMFNSRSSSLGVNVAAIKMPLTPRSYVGNCSAFDCVWLMTRLIRKRETDWRLMRLRHMPARGVNMMIMVVILLSHTVERWMIIPLSKHVARKAKRF
jgi:hypothetical protein